MNAQVKIAMPQVGTTVLGINDQKGWIAEINEARAQTFTIGGGGMVPNTLEYVIVWDNQTTSIVSDGIAAPWINKAALYEFAIINDAPERLAEARECERLDYEKRMELNDKRAIERAAFFEDARGKVPAWAKAVIVAELQEDKSDIYSDYHGSSTVRTVILAFSKHTRDLFPEMRKAALNFEETAHLATAPDDAEHRQKYSMGGGYFLKAGYRHKDGWKISKSPLNAENLHGLPFGEWSLGTSEAPKMSAQAIGNVTVEQHVHTKKGFDMFIVIMADRVERETYLDLLDKAKSLGGWYSKKWGQTPAGFAFKDEGKAQEFANELSGTNAPKPDGTPPAPSKSPAIADKFRALADKMQRDIDHKLGDRLTNTPKRQREAQSARNDGLQLERAQQALRALADLHEQGTISPILATVKSKKQAVDLCRGVISQSTGYYDAGYDQGKPYDQDELTLAVWALLGAPDPKDVKAQQIKQLSDKINLTKVEGFFPTPAPIVEQMLGRLGAMPDNAEILEPSAGSGAILDQLREAYPKANLTAFEIYNPLRDLLELKGYELHGWDFMEDERGLLEGAEFDAVVMNPPFEKQQDVDHVQRAWRCLKPGGVLVAIMSPSAFFRSDKKSQAFRQWFEDNNGHKVDIDAGAFKASGTNVSTVMISVEKWS